MQKILFYMIIFILAIGTVIALYLLHKNNKEKYAKSFSGLPKIPKMTKKLLASSVASEHNCTQFHEKLEKEGKKGLLNIKSFSGLLLPTSPPKNCETCKVILEGWKRFDTILYSFSDFLKNKKLPSKPNIKLIKPCCKNLNKNCEEYADKIIGEIKCLQTKKTDCSEEDLPTFKADEESKTCAECQNLYAVWFTYTASLIDIANYVRNLKQK